MRSELSALGIVAASAIGIPSTQPSLAGAVHATAKQRDDTYVLPPPRALGALTLGYHATAVDLLWAKLLVEYGMHFSEKRSFDDIPRYLDAIFALEPDYYPAYRYVGTLLAYRPLQGTEADVRKARAYLERGAKETRRYDHRVWLEYGQFVAFIGPSFLTNDADKEAWRRDGAAAMATAVDLGADPDRVVAAATILSKAGERDAAITHLRRAYAMTDDPQTRDEIRRKLELLDASAIAEAAEKDGTFLESARRSEFPFLDPAAFLLIGPNPDPVRCAGVIRPERGSVRCARDWGPLLPSAEALEPTE
jgi:hypothetical protein